MTGRLSLEEAERICRGRALPLTVQRRVVLEDLAPRVDHPTADHIFSNVRKLVPEISRTTVYRVLEAFVRVGVARKVCHPGAAARYEILGDRHHHLVCLQCGRMTDIEDPRLDQIPFPDSEVGGFEFSDYSIQFRGLCANCVRSRAASDHGSSKIKGRGRNKQSAD